MPIDPYHLDRQRPTPEPKAPSRTIAWVVFAVGLIALLLVFAVAVKNPAVRKESRFFTGAAISVGLVIHAITGFNNDGILGAWFYSRQPLGSALDPDPRPRSPVVIAIVWLLGIAAIMNVLLLFI